MIKTFQVQGISRVWFMNLELRLKSWSHKTGKADITNLNFRFCGVGKREEYKRIPRHKGRRGDMDTMAKTKSR